MHGVGGLPVRAAQHRRLTQLRWHPDRHGKPGQHVPLDVAHIAVELGQGHLRGAGLAQGLGADVPHLPRRPRPLQHLKDAVGDDLGTHVPTPPLPVASLERPHPVTCGDARVSTSVPTASLVRPHHRGDELGDGHVPTGPAPGVQGAGLGPPLAPLLGLGAGFVLGRAGLQVRLLRQRQRLDRGRGTAVVGPEHRGQLALAELDGLPAAGPHREQPGVHPGDLPHRPAPLRAGAVDEPDPEPVHQARFEVGVVVLGGHHLRLEQHPPVQRQPPPALLRQGLDLVGDDHVGVQVRVPGARVTVVERRRHQPGDGDLPDPALTDPGERHLLSSIARVARTASSCAASTCRATSGGANAHSAETDFTGENVRSNPATGTCAGRDADATNPVSSRLVHRRPAVPVLERLPGDLGADRRPAPPEGWGGSTPTPGWCCAR